MKITIKNSNGSKFTNNIQFGFKIYKTNNLVWNWRNQLVDEKEVEKWIIKWGNNKIITALIYLIKQDDFYHNEIDHKKLLKISLVYSSITKKLQASLLSHLPSFEEDNNSIDQLLKFIK